MDQKIVYIRLDRLMAHPENPRKDLGDLTELTASIKANGILQNLTVVPYWSPVHKRIIEGMYTVIIGHRRMAAAKDAGLQEAPCIIADMTPEQQISTMLVENMQRSDLSIYEQAVSFHQLTMDFGMETAEIAKISGFSESTVRRRQKMGQIDRKQLKKACERGATMQDFIDLDKVKTEDGREEALKDLGTSNFRNTLKKVLDRERAQEKLDKTEEELKTWATEIQECGIANGRNVPMAFHATYGVWKRYTPEEKPADADSKHYYYRRGNDYISIYEEKQETAEEQELKAQQEADTETDYSITRQLEGMRKRHHELRMEFVANFGNFREYGDRIMEEAAATILLPRNSYNQYGKSKVGLYKMLHIRPENEESSRKPVRGAAHENPARTLLCAMAWLIDSPDAGWISSGWSPKYNRSRTTYRDNQDLDNWVYFLIELGYQESDEERHIRRGDHPLLADPEDWERE